VRGVRVMLAANLAELYGVPTSALNQAVDRNPARFPEDFAFRLTAEEAERLRSQTVISIRGRGGPRTPPRAFTEQGVAMLSSVLHSQCAIAMNVLIMRTFVRLRRVQSDYDYADLRRRLEELERRIGTELTVRSDSAPSDVESQEFSARSAEVSANASASVGRPGVSASKSTKAELG
jgi:hypothetical protein